MTFLGETPGQFFTSLSSFKLTCSKVVGEGANRTVVYDEDEGFDDSMIPYKSFKEYETNAWETGSIGGESEKSRETTRTGQSQMRSVRHSVPYNGTTYGSPYGQPGYNRSQSMYSATDVNLPAGADYWRDSSPLGPNHSSRNLRNMPSNPSLRHSVAGSELAGRPMTGPMGGMPDARSMAGMSMWGPGSEYGGSQRGPGPEHAPFLHPMATGMSSPSMGPMGMGPMGPMGPMGMGMPMGPMGPMGYHNPYGPSPQPYDYLRPQSMMGPYTGAAPRNSVMSGLGSYAGAGAGTRMSSYSLATTANPFAGAGPLGPGSDAGNAGSGAGVQAEALTVDEREEVEDEEVLETLRKFLAGQDLMRV